MPSLTLYYRRDCHLCEQMLAEIHALYDESLEVRLVDVDSESGLKQRYGLKVPVLTGNDQELCHGRLDTTSLEEYLQSL
ncbi:MAG TPA: glutaredoxin family protein [Gammaproteobacteria bacterium]|nr:glutaredoxin family protein [Gammaproteobacteria bacterium]